MEKKEKILIIDDNLAHVEMIYKKLETLGYDVLKAHNGEQGLREVYKSKPDVILLDVMMQGMNGFDVVKALKQEPDTSIIPVIMITGIENVEEMANALLIGADDLLSKPVNVLELNARIRSMIKLKRLQEEIFLKNIPSSISENLFKKALNDEDDKKCIMIVDNDPMSIEFITQNVQSVGYRVLCAKNGTELLSLVKNELPDLILLDILLPDINGLNLLKELREKPNMTDIPVIMISCLDDLETKIKGIENGADDFLVKPVNSIELKARIKANLRKYSCSQREKINKAYFRQNVIDKLTGLYNHEYFNLILNKEFEISKRYNTVFSLIMLDIDFFKNINKSFGLAAGDGILKDVAAVIKNNIRSSDIAIRHEVDRFIIVLFHTAVGGAVTISEKLRSKIEESQFGKSGEMAVTASIGVTCYLDSDSQLSTVIGRLGQALKIAKDNGRNNVKELAF